MAVYTQLSNETITNIVQEYGLGNLISATEIAEGIENSNYLIETSLADMKPEKSILTIYENRTNIDDLPFFLGVMEDLAGNGISCPLPRHTINNTQTIKLDNGKTAAMVTFLNGKSQTIINNNHIISLGKTIAKMHIAGEEFNQHRANNLSVKGWKNLLLEIGNDKNRINNALYQELQQEMEWLEVNWVKDLPSGIIHADLFPDNVFFVDNEVSGIIDFYFACNDYFIYDIAIAINAWCFDNDAKLNISKVKSLIDNYNVIRPITQAERDSLPVICRGAAMRFLLTRIYDKIHTPKNALVTTKNPQEYLDKLHFHQQVKNYQEYGL